MLLFWEGVAVFELCLLRVERNLVNITDLTIFRVAEVTTLKMVN